MPTYYEEKNLPALEKKLKPRKKRKWNGQSQ
jgi:hypothetical protein